MGLAALLLLTAPSAHAADDQASFSNTNPLTSLGDNVMAGFSGVNLVLHLSAVSLTPAMVFSGADTELHNVFARQGGLDDYSAIGVYFGYVGPPVLIGTLFAGGLLGDSRRTLAAASAATQALALAVLYNGLLKAVTGRPPPDPVQYGDDSASRTFRFGLLRGGVHYGWPSGHMMTSAAIFASLWPIYPDSWVFKITSSVLLLGVATAVAVHDSSSMHWSSDMVAGTLFGFAIGNGVGQGFARHLDGESKPADIGLAPMPPSAGRVGIVLGGSF